MDKKEIIMNEKKEYYLIAKDRLIKQLENVDFYNSKINTLLVTCGVLIAFLGELASRGNLILGIGLPFIVISVCILLWAYRISEWQDTPNPEYVLHELKESSKINVFYKDATEDIVKCYQENKILINKKTKRINASSLFLMLGIFSTLIGLAIYLF